MKKEIYNFCLLILVIIVLFFLIVALIDRKEGMELAEDVARVGIAYALNFQRAAAVAANITVAVNNESDSDSQDDQTIEDNVVETLCNELSNIDNDIVKNFIDASHEECYHKLITDYLTKKKELKDKLNGSQNFENNFEQMIHFLSNNKSQDDISLEMTNIFVCNGEIRNITIDYLDSKIQNFSDPHPDESEESIITEIFNELSGNYSTQLNSKTDTVGYLETAELLNLNNPLSEAFTTMNTSGITGSSDSETTSTNNSRQKFNKLVLKKKLMGLNISLSSMKATLETGGNKGGQFLTNILIPSILIGEHHLNENGEVPNDSDIDICNLTGSPLSGMLSIFGSNDCN